MTEPAAELEHDDDVVATAPAGTERSPRAVDAPEAPGRRAPAALSELWAELTALWRALSAVVSRARGRARIAVLRLGALTGTADTAWWQPVSPARSIANLVRGPRPCPGTTLDATGRATPWSRAFAVGLTAFALWALLDAPTLLRTAQGSPIGARRTAAMVMLRPLAAVSRDLGLSHVVGAADRVLGRTGGGVVQVVGPPVHHHRHAVHARHATASAPPAAPSDALPPLPVPTAAAPLRVLSIGDSLGVDFGGPFVNDLAATGVVNAALDAHIDTGLSRPDYFDWPAELQADLARYQPQVVVVFLGANDPQDILDGGTALSYGTPAWGDAYARRVAQVMQEATSAGARVVWVGMPPMSDPVLGAKMQALNGIFQAQAAIRPGVTYVSSWPVFSDAQGAFAEYLPDASGAQVAVREPDGTHVSPAGAERLSQAVIAAMDRAWGLALHP